MIKTSGSRSRVLSTLDGGSLFGQIALVANVPRSASLVASTDCTLVEITRETFERLLASGTSEVALRLREYVAVSGIRRCAAPPSSSLP